MKKIYLILILQFCSVTLLAKNYDDYPQGIPTEFSSSYGSEPEIQEVLNHEFQFSKVKGKINSCHEKENCEGEVNPNVAMIENLAHDSTTELCGEQKKPLYRKDVEFDILNVQKILEDTANEYSGYCTCDFWKDKDVFPDGKKEKCISSNEEKTARATINAWIKPLQLERIQRNYFSFVEKIYRLEVLKDKKFKIKNDLDGEKLVGQYCKGGSLNKLMKKHGCLKADKTGHSMIEDLFNLNLKYFKGEGQWRREIAEEKVNGSNVESFLADSRYTDHILKKLKSVKIPLEEQTQKALLDKRNLKRTNNACKEELHADYDDKFISFSEGAGKHILGFQCRSSYAYEKLQEEIKNSNGKMKIDLKTKELVIKEDGKEIDQSTNRLRLGQLMLGLVQKTYTDKIKDCSDLKKSNVLDQVIKKANRGKGDVASNLRYVYEKSSGRKFWEKGKKQKDYTEGQKNYRKFASAFENLYKGHDLTAEDEKVDSTNWQMINNIMVNLAFDPWQEAEMKMKDFDDVRRNMTLVAAMKNDIEQECESIKEQTKVFCSYVNNKTDPLDQYAMEPSNYQSLAEVFKDDETRYFKDDELKKRAKKDLNRAFKIMYCTEHVQKAKKNNVNDKIKELEEKIADEKKEEKREELIKKKEKLVAKRDANRKLADRPRNVEKDGLETPNEEVAKVVAAAEFKKVNEKMKEQVGSDLIYAGGIKPVEKYQEEILGTEINNQYSTNTKKNQYSDDDLANFYNNQIGKFSKPRSSRSIIKKSNEKLKAFKTARLDSNSSSKTFDNEKKSTRAVVTRIPASTRSNPIKAVPTIGGNDSQVITVPQIQGGASKVTQNITNVYNNQEINGLKDQISHLEKQNEQMRVALANALSAKGKENNPNEISKLLEELSQKDDELLEKDRELKQRISELERIRRIEEEKKRQAELDHDSKEEINTSTNNTVGPSHNPFTTANTKTVTKESSSSSFPSSAANSFFQGGFGAPAGSSGGSRANGPTQISDGYWANSNESISGNLTRTSHGGGSYHSAVYLQAIKNKLGVEDQGQDNEVNERAKKYNVSFEKGENGESYLVLKNNGDTENKEIVSGQTLVLTDHQARREIALPLQLVEEVKGTIGEQKGKSKNKKSEININQYQDIANLKRVILENDELRKKMANKDEELLKAFNEQIQFILSKNSFGGNRGIASISKENIQFIKENENDIINGANLLEQLNNALDEVSLGSQ